MKEKKEICELLNQYGRMLLEQAHAPACSVRFYLKGEGKIWGNRYGADVTALSDEDIRLLSMASEMSSSEQTILQFFEEAEDKGGMVLCQPPYCLLCLQKEKKITAILDDMAQIIGREAKILSGTLPELKETLGEAGGCLLAVHNREEDKKAGYAVTVGRSLYEAVVAATVLEKSAEVFLKAEVLGGGVPIPVEEAERMRRLYREQYSRAEQQVRAAQEKGAGR